MKPALNRMVRGQTGVALVEVLVAMLIGVFLVGGMLQVFASSRLTYRVHDATARMQETGRMALELLSRDIRMAGFWGCAGDPDNVVNNLDPTGAGFIDFSAGGVVGVEGGPDIPDGLTVRGGTDLGLEIQPPYGPQPSAALHVMSGNDLEQGDIVIVSDCSRADIFQISNANPDSSGSIVHNTGETTEPGNYNATNPGCPGTNAHCLSKVYGADASLFLARNVEYRVDTGVDAEPALFRNGEELLNGVEDLQILYGEDRDAPGSPGFGVANYYVPANAVTDMSSVISIRFAVVVRSSGSNLTNGARQSYNVLGTTRIAGDTRLRQVYTRTVTVRNRL